MKTYYLSHAEKESLEDLAEERWESIAYMHRNEAFEVIEECVNECGIYSGDEQKYRESFEYFWNEVKKKVDKRRQDVLSENQLV